MGIELADNVFQTVILLLCAAIAVFHALRNGRKSLWILAFAYVSFGLGTLYYVLHLALVGHVPQVFYVAESSWLASHLFILSLQLSHAERIHVDFAPIPAICAVLAAACAVVFGAFGPSVFMEGCYAIVAGAGVYLSLWRILRKSGAKNSAVCLLLVPLLQILLYTVSEFTKDYSRFSLYYAVDILLTADLAALLPIFYREERV